jgi:hypothetical protein
MDIAKEMRDLANEPIVTADESRALLRKGADEIDRLRKALMAVAVFKPMPGAIAKAPNGF